MSDITRSLSQMEANDPAAVGQLLPLVYAELRKLATEKMANERAGQTLPLLEQTLEKRTAKLGPDHVTRQIVAAGRRRFSLRDAGAVWPAGR